jgi:hypothetical protein
MMGFEGLPLTVQVVLGTFPLLLTFLICLWRIERFFGAFLTEHEILIRWYCEQHGIELSNLATRIRSGIWRSK